MHIPYCSLLALLCGMVCSEADVSLPAIFSDHAVLVKSAKVRLWGNADAGERIALSLGVAKAVAKAGADGKWEAVLDLSQCGPGPFELVVNGKNRLVIADVAVGEVWVCSGQSNMELPLKKTADAAGEFAASGNRLLRQFAVKKNPASVPAEAMEGKWVCAAPETVGDFSAAGYYFGKALQQKLKVPIGLIHSSWGGTPSEAWTSSEALASDPDLAEGAKRSEARLKDYPKALENYLSAMARWQEQVGRNDRPAEGRPGEDGWRPVRLPGNLPGAGALWLRRTVDVSPCLAGKPLTIAVGPLQCVEQVFWNGVKIGEASVERAIRGGGRSYTVPAHWMREGKALLEVRIFSPVADKVVPRDFVVGQAILAGGWEMKYETLFPPLSDAVRTSMPVSPGKEPGPQITASYLFNGMIAPLARYSIRGVLWYQGESNSIRAYQYRKAFPLLIRDWRKQWNQGDFPFYFCQIANYKTKQTNPEDPGMMGRENWPELRESQSLALTLPNTAQAILIDIGESGDIHPQNKKEVGERLARIAFARDYHMEVPYSGPAYESMKIEGHEVVLSFRHTEGGLLAKALSSTYDVRSVIKETAPLVRNSPHSQLEGFAICGADQKWVWADAKIDGNRVAVWADQIPAPVAVRYAWADNPTCNLYNGAGLPASPFRTDDFPLMTQNVKF